MSLPIKIQLPEHFLDEEVRCNYTITYKMKKVWAVEIDLLFEFKRISEKHKLEWFACGGTTLGAVRHNGFIPWDDDIDVYMPRKDYDIFCKVVKKEITEPYFFSDGSHQKRIFQCHSTLRNSMTTAIYKGCDNKQNTFNQGIFIDIFALDTIPENPIERDKFICQLESKFDCCQKITSWADYYTPKRGYGMLAYSKRLCKHIYALFTRRLYYSNMHALLKRFKDKDSPFCANLMLFPFADRRIFKSEIMKNAKTVDFEWFEIPVPNDVEEYLTQVYGNWRIPIKGTTLHQGIYFDPELPYKEYIKTL